MTVCSVSACERAAHANGLCGAHYQKYKRHGDPTITKHVPFVGSIDQRFDYYFTKLGPNECWPWHGTMDGHGYGRFSIKHKYTGAHQYAYVRANGPISAGSVVDHTCHNRDIACMSVNDCLHRRCVNPNHLEAVSRRENAQRGKFRIPTCAKGHLRNMFTKQNECGECARLRAKRRYHARKVAA